MSDYKTTTTGIVMVVGSLTALIYAVRSKSLDQATVTGSLTGIFGGIGLIFAKDSTKNKQ